MGRGVWALPLRLVATACARGARGGDGSRRPLEQEALVARAARGRERVMTPCLPCRFS